MALLRIGSLREQLGARPFVIEPGPGAVGSLFAEGENDTRRHKHKQPFDKWRNGGGKNGRLVRPVPPELVGGETGLELARRRGFVHRGGADGEAAFKYSQFHLGRNLKSASPANKGGSPEPGERVLLLYQVVSESRAASRAARNRSARPRAKGGGGGGGGAGAGQHPATSAGTADEDFLLGQDTASGQDDVAAVNNATQVR